MNADFLKLRVIKKQNARRRRETAINGRRARGDHEYWWRMGAWLQILDWRKSHPEEYKAGLVLAMSANSLYGKRTSHAE